MNFGYYRVDEDEFSLHIDGLAAIEVPYSCSSGLPAAKGIPGLCGPSSNLCVLTMDNNNFSMGQKTLPEWHHHCGHLGHKFSLYYIIFLSPRKNSAAAKCILTLCKICEFVNACHCSKGAL